MNRKSLFILFLVLVAAAVFTRVLPYLLQFDAVFFQPIMAIGIFSITTFRKEKTSILVPLAALLLSDLVIEIAQPGMGFYSGQAINYLLMAVSIGFAYFFNGKKSVQVAGAAVLVPFVYYLLSNGLMVFAPHANPFYTRDISGMFASLDAGFPFFLKDLVSTALFSAVFFGVYRYLVAKNYIKAWA
ncbi:MAG: hypothetical protein JNM68_11185 [Dinghuibacter sp.]|nr:hypothetical protein [Dinghuibacter sp.]